MSCHIYNIYIYAREWRDVNDFGANTSGYKKLPQENSQSDPYIEFERESGRKENRFCSRPNSQGGSGGGGEELRMERCKAFKLLSSDG